MKAPMTTPHRQNPYAPNHALPSGLVDLGGALMQSGLVPFALVENGNIIGSSPALRDLLAASSPYHHIDGHPLASIVDAADRDAVAGFCSTLLQERPRAELRCRLAQADGSALPVLLAGAAITVDERRQLVLVATDLSPWLGEDGGPLTMPLADAFDPATGFPRRALLLDRLRIALAAARRHRRRAAVLRVELENFEALLAALVPRAAEEIEATVAETLRNCVRDSDTVARLDRQVFVLVLAEIGERDDAGISAARVLAAIAALFERNPAAPAPVLARIGVCVYPTDGINPERLLYGAEIAVQTARSMDGGGFALADATTAELATVEELAFGDAQLLGVPDLDEEHRTLVARTNAVVHNLKLGVPALELARDVREIEELLRRHFDSEARLLASSPYDGAADEKTANRRFLEELDCILRHVNTQSVLLAVRHLHDWLVPHLARAQRRLAS